MIMQAGSGEIWGGTDMLLEISGRDIWLLVIGFVSYRFGAANCQNRQILLSRLRRASYAENTSGKFSRTPARLYDQTDACSGRRSGPGCPRP